MDYSDTCSPYMTIVIFYIYIYIYYYNYYVVHFTYFCKTGGGGGGELRFSVLLRPEFFYVFRPVTCGFLWSIQMASISSVGLPLIVVVLCFQVFL